MTRHRIRQSGYVLVMALVLLVIAAVALSSMARRSLRAAVEANTTAEQLQEDWGSWSIQHTLLPEAERLITEAEELTGEPTTSLRHELTLGDMNVILFIEDESAKVNVNHLLSKQERYEADTQITELLRETESQLTVRLRPHQWKDAAEQTDPVASYGQVFDPCRPDAVRPADEETVAISDMLTCWGDQKLNIKRASQLALQLVASPEMDRIAIQRLIDARASSPDASLGKLLAAAQLSEDTLKKIQDKLTDKSSCQSIWLINQTDRQTRWRQYVRWATQEKEDQPEQAFTKAFIW